MSIMIGKKLADRYEIIRELGRGGMGIVYLARDPLLDRDVAVKIVTPAYLSPEGIERFKREAKTVAKMDHPAVVVVHDIGEEQGSLFFVMPYVTGTNLRTFLDDRSLSLGEVLDIGIQVAEALEYSNSQGIVHRDIKPENIMVARQQMEGVRVRITDFGLAMAATEHRLTLSGALVGTIAYLSPEQLSAQTVDGRSDIYSLGAVLYECLVGQPPFTGDVRSILYRIVHEIPQPLRLLLDWVDEDLEVIVMQCLEKDPLRRQQRGWEVAESLTRYRHKLQDSEWQRRVYSSSTANRLHHRPDVSFVGREKEFVELQRRLNLALTGECQFVVVTGEPGIGKSRLLEELENLVRLRKFPVFHGRFVELDQSFPYQGFCEVIQESFRSMRNASEPLDFSDLAPELLSLFPVLTEIEELRSSLAASAKLVPVSEARKVEDRTYIFELLARALARIAGGRPMAVLLEDLHAADVSVEALQYIVRRLSPTPTLIVATYRATEVDKGHPLIRMLDSFQGDRRFSLIRLGPLSTLDHRAFIEGMIGTRKLDDSFADRLYAATEGNPYFTKELVRSLVDSKGIVREDSGSWVLSNETGISSETLPATVQQTIKKRIERLPKDMRDLLSVASVLGKTFELRDLEMLIEETGKEDLVDRIVEEGFLEEVRQSRGDRLNFSSGILRDVLYAGLTSRKRRSVHCKYAEELEKRNSGRLERVYPQLVHNYLHGDVPEKVVEYGLKLAGKALEAYSAEDAIRSARMVLDSLEEIGGENQSFEAKARMILSEAQRMTGNIDAALKEVAEAIRIYEHLNLLSDAVRAILAATETAWEGRRVDEAKRWVEQGLGQARISGETEILIRFLSYGATIANLRGEYEKAREYQLEAEQLQPASKQGEEEIPHGGVLVVALSPPIRWTYTSDVLTEESEVFGNIFETLLTSDPRGNLIPSLCERWEVLDNGRAFLFTLCQGVRMHDGRTLTAQVIKTSLENRIQRSRNSLPAGFTTIRAVSPFLEGSAPQIEGIQALSDYKLEIQLQEALPIYPALLTDSRTAIMLENPEAGPMIGTGPFKIVSLEPSRVVLERNSDYWKGISSFLDVVEFRGALSAAEIAAGFRSGEFDLARDLMPEDLDEILQDRRLRAGLCEAPKKNIYFILFNRSSPAARIPMVRWALLGTVRTHDLVRGTLGRFAQPAEGLFPPGILGHDPGKRRQALAREKALELLHSSRMPFPIRLKASVHPIFQDRYASLTKALFKVWEDVGVQISIETPNIASFQEKVRDTEGIDLMIGRWIADYDDPDNFTYGLFHSRIGRYRNYYSSNELDQLMEEARAESRPNVREKLYRKADDLLMETAFFLPLFHDIDYRLVNPRVRGLTLRSSPPYINYMEVGKAVSAAPSTIRKGGGGVIHVPIVSEILTMDPAVVSTVVQSEVLPTVFENLTREADGARIVPWLASEFQAEEGGRRFRFHLREDVRFHDGHRLTARDVRYSFERFLQSQLSESRWLLSPIRGARDLLSGEAQSLEGFKILSSSEFTIDLEKPISFFPAILAYPAAAIIPEGSNSFDGSWRDGCVGTGPFRVTRFDPSKSLELEANQYYWRPEYPKSDGLIFKFGVPPSDILAGFRSGQYSLAWDLFPTDVEALRREFAFASRYRDTPRLSTYYVVFNVHKGPLMDESLRRQLVDAIDVEGLVRRNLGRLAIPAHSLIPPGLLGYEPKRQIKPAASRERQSPKGVELVAARNSVYQDRYSTVAGELLGAFSEKGIRIRLQETKFEIYNRELALANVDLAIERWVADYPDADTFLHGLLHSQKGLVGKFCGSPEIDQLIEKARIESEPAMRHHIYREIEEIIARRALLLPLFHEQAYRFAGPNVEGLDVTFALPHVAYEKLWVRR